MEALEKSPIGQFKLPSKTFDFLRALCEVVLPGLAVIYASMGSYLEMPYATEVAEWAAALAAIIGIIVNTARYNTNRDNAAEAAKAFEKDAVDG